MNTTVSIDGQPVASGTAAAFAGLAADFQARTGFSLHVTDGYRSYEQQAELYRLWQAGKGNLAAAPGHSEHETGRALDVHDSGADAGVTTIGTVRHSALAAIAGAHGFRMTGDTFSPREGWHIEFWGGDQWAAPVSNTPTITTKGNTDMFIGLKGAAGKRRGGVYYVKDGKATFISGSIPAGVPTFTDEAAIGNLQRVISGLA